MFCMYEFQWFVYIVTVHLYIGYIYHMLFEWGFCHPIMPHCIEWQVWQYKNDFAHITTGSSQSDSKWSDTQCDQM